MEKPDKSKYLLSLALGKDFADRTAKLPAIPPGSKVDYALAEVKRRGTWNSPGRS
jgi:hypothetical protein